MQPSVNSPGVPGLIPDLARRSGLGDDGAYGLQLVGVNHQPESCIAAAGPPTVNTGFGPIPALMPQCLAYRRRIVTRDERFEPEARGDRYSHRQNAVLSEELGRNDSIALLCRKIGAGVQA